MHLTQKQLELLSIISKANPDGSPTDLNEIIERLSYKPTKEAVQFSIRALIAHELIEKVGSDNRRGRRRVLISCTSMGKHFATATDGVSFVSSEEEDKIIEEANEVFN